MHLWQNVWQTVWSCAQTLSVAVREWCKWKSSLANIFAKASSSLGQTTRTLPVWTAPDKNSATDVVRLRPSTRRHMKIRLDASTFEVVSFRYKIPMSIHIASYRQQRKFFSKFRAVKTLVRWGAPQYRTRWWQDHQVFCYLVARGYSIVQNYRILS